MKRLTGKRGKIYRELLKSGKSEPYAKRISKGLSEGKSLKSARGFHKAERYAGLKKAYQPAPKGRLDQPLSGWKVYYYADWLDSEKAGKEDSPFGFLNSYDVTKTQIQNYEKNGSQEALFAIHQWLERAIQHYFKLKMGIADIKEINYDGRHEVEKKQKHRRFDCDIIDIHDGPLFWLSYEKGNFLVRHMFEEFDYAQFKLEMREQRIWE